MLGIEASLILREFDKERGFCPSGELLQHLVSCAPQENGLELLADFLQVSIAEDAARLVDNSMFMKELEGGAKPAIVHELDDAIQFLQAVL
jgi:hypothetical protein